MDAEKGLKIKKAANGNWYLYYSGRFVESFDTWAKAKAFIANAERNGLVPFLGD